MVFRTHLFLFIFISGSLFSGNVTPLGAMPAALPDSIHLNHSQSFTFRPGAVSGGDGVTNALLQVLSEGNNKMRVYTSYAFHASLLLRPDMSEESAELNLKVLHKKITGDSCYKDFCPHSYLIPSLLDLQVVAENGDGQLLYSRTVENIHWQNTPVSFDLPGFRVPNSRENEIHFKVKNLRFKYAEKQMEHAVFLAEALSSYYAAEQQLEQISHLTTDLNVSVPDNLIHNEFRLCEAENMLGILSFAPFHEFLVKEASDPRDILIRMEEKRIVLSGLRAEFNKALAHIDELFYARGNELLVSADTMLAMQNFERVVSYNPLHIPANITLAGFDLSAGAPDRALARMKRLMGHVPVPGKWEDDAVRFTSYLFDFEIYRAGELMDDGRYLDALKVLELLNDFCRNIEQWQCPVRLFESEVRAHYGMYNSYLSVARRAFASGNFSFALTYLESAGQYQDANIAHIPDDTDVVALTRQVLNGYYAQADQALSFNDFATALFALEQAFKLCENNPRLVCRANTDELIAYTQQQKLMAEKLRAELVISEPRVLPADYSYQQAAQAVKEKLSLGHLRAWAGDTDEAREIIAEILEYSLRYDLRRDTTINERIINLTDMIRDKECELEEREISGLLSALNSKLSRGFYREAMHDYQRAIDLQEQSTHCPWSFKDTLGLLSYVQNLAEYQSLIHEAQSAYFRGASEGFTAFFYSYIRAQEFYEQHKLESFDLKHTSMDEFVLTSSNISLTKEAVTYFARQGAHDNALKMLQSLKENRLDPREVRYLQEQAGAKAAIAHFALQPQIQPRIFVREKTHNDAWYRYYVRSFISAWDNQAL